MRAVQIPQARKVVELPCGDRDAVIVRRWRGRVVANRLGDHAACAFEPLAVCRRRDLRDLGADAVWHRQHLSEQANIGAHEAEVIAAAAAAWASSIVRHQIRSIQRSPSASYESSREMNPCCCLIQLETASPVASSRSCEIPSLSLKTTSSRTLSRDEAIGHSPLGGGCRL